MDRKARKIFNHYKIIIENNSFDEYDILGFLILMRSYLDKNKYPCIYEICDLIAHRKRNRGMIMSAIENVIKNKYEYKGKRLKGYQGISQKRWIKEWERFGKNYKMKLTEQTIFEIMLSVFSILQFTEYSSKKGGGMMKLVQGKDNKIALVTTEGKLHSKQICYSIIHPYRFHYVYPGGIIKEPVETKRVGKELQLFASKTRII